MIPIFFIFFTFFFQLTLGNDFLDIARDRILINKNPLQEKTDYEWTIVGAGVAGIIAISILLDLGIPSESIYWVDPLFNVGRIGEYYENVTANSANKFWISFLKASPTIEKITQKEIEVISNLDPNGYSTLSLILPSMQKVTEHFKSFISYQTGYTDYLEFFDSVWHVGVNNTIKSSRNVILATGCKPVVLDYAKHADTIPLDYALDPQILEKMVKPQDSIAVFGGSHSAILILKYLSSFNVNSIYNFYKYPCIYAIDMGDWVLNNSNGLKGEAAIWAKNILENNPPKNLHRIMNSNENRKKYLPYCNKIIYAIGYEKNPLPAIIHDGSSVDDISFDPQSGIIGTRIFGIGIAFPGMSLDPMGNKEQGIGLNSFMRYALQVMPEWIKSKHIESKDSIYRLLNQLYIFDQMINISML
jgi:hypothetical protein